MLDPAVPASLDDGLRSPPMVSGETRLVEVIDALLGKGVVLRGELWLTVAGVDLVFAGTDVLLATPDKMGRSSSGLAAPPTSKESGMASPTHPVQATSSSRRQEASGSEAATRVEPETSAATGTFETSAESRDDVRQVKGLRLTPDTNADAPASAEVAQASSNPPHDPSVGNPQRSALTLDPETVQQDLARIVLGLMEFLRQLMELQAIRRVEGRTLSVEQEEKLGLTLMRAEDAIAEQARAFGLSPDDLSLDLGPLGRTI